MGPSRRVFFVPYWLWHSWRIFFICDSYIKRKTGAHFMKMDQWTVKELRHVHAATSLLFVASSWSINKSRLECENHL